MFETDSDRQVFDPSLNEKTDSMFYTLGILKGLQQVADQYVLQGEMRGDLTATNEFVVVSTDGYIRTYFKPDSGLRYYNKQ